MIVVEDHIPHPLFRVSLAFPAVITGEEATALGDKLEELENAVSVFLHNRESTDGDNWTITLTTMGQPDVTALLGLIDNKIGKDGVHVEKLPEQDWLRHVHENFPPVTLGRFFIYGSHYEGDVPKDTLPLNIDAATAFGSGEHETTKGCILAMEELAAKNSFSNMLDMGCGSGILAIAAAKIWPGIKATAVDIDPESIIVTARHAKMNGVTLMAEAGDGYKSPVVSANGPYDLITANILAGPLIDMADEAFAHLLPGGYAVLSGLLARQEKDVIDAHEKAGFVFIRAIAINDWRALVLQKKES